MFQRGFGCAASVFAADTKGGMTGQECTAATLLVCLFVRALQLWLSWPVGFCVGWLGWAGRGCGWDEQLFGAHIHRQAER